MAVNKRQLDDKFFEKHKEEIDKLQQIIDKELNKSYEPGRGCRVNLDDLPNLMIQAAITRIYNDEGWDLEFDSGRNIGVFFKSRDFRAI